MAIDAFDVRVMRLPHLGLGISTEYGAARHGLDIVALRRARPDLAAFLEVGADLARGIDADAAAWVAAGWPTTYHFLDVNLEEPEDQDDAWVEGVRALATRIGAAWLCGDGGIWHMGPRDRGHGTLLPPVLCDTSASSMADAVRALRERTGLEVLPENPPAHVFVGDLHLLDYFARVVERADSGLVLDAAHLAIYQRAAGLAPTTGLDGFPLERVVELHVAGGTEFVHGGRVFVDDDHVPEPLADTWTIAEAVIARAPNLRAVVYECERNPVACVLPSFERLAKLLSP
jgi:uncharacterized protein (UPF0276 family)